MEPQPSPWLPSDEPTSAWLRGDGPLSDVVVSSRVRLARNIAGHRFVNRASREERQEILDRCRSSLLHAGLSERIMWIELHESTPLERLMLVERHLISKQHARGKVNKSLGGSPTDEPRAVAVSIPDERLAVMVNEEDHLRIQVVRSGLSLQEAWIEIDQVDDKIESGLDYSYSSRWGYMTACATNLGTGVRMSVMLHLPALKLTGDIEKVKKAAADMCLAVRGFYGEGSEAIGDFYQISNQITLGKSESVLLHELAGEIIPQIVEYERIARRSLLAKRSTFIEDQVHRALGILSNARLLNGEESMQLLSQLRLGVVMGLIKTVDLPLVNHLTLLSQPGHVQKTSGKELDQDQRRLARAALMRARLAKP
jgi:protein arginine kinase